MNYKQYIKLNENVDTIILPDGRSVSYINDKRAVIFIVNNNLYMFAQQDVNIKRTTVIILKDDIILMFTYFNPYANIVHGDLIETIKDFETFYATNQSINNIEILIDKTQDVREMVKIATNANFSTDTGRIFLKVGAVAVREEIIQPEDIRDKFNSVAQYFKSEHINGNWIFETSNEKTGKVKQYYYSDLTKQINQTDTKFIINQYENPAPDIIMDKDWRNAVRILSDGFMHGIETARQSMNKTDFNNFIKRQLPKIHQASLRVGESKKHDTNTKIAHKNKSFI